MNGNVYYADEGLFEGDSGWEQDRINSETVISFDLDEITIDYRIKQGDSWVTPEMEGGGATFIGIDEDSSFQFLAVWPNASVEVITIAEIDKENYTATMLLAQGKNSSFSTTAGAFKGECTVTSF